LKNKKRLVKKIKTMKVANNYPLGMHPPIGAYKHPTDNKEWEHCPKCGFKPRIWEYDNGRSTHCGCSNSKYDHFSVRAKSIIEVMGENDGSAAKYDRDELRKNWNEYCRDNS
jgi:hypothetical protein